MKSGATEAEKVLLKSRIQRMLFSLRHDESAAGWSDGSVDKVLEVDWLKRYLHRLFSPTTNHMSFATADGAVVAINNHGVFRSDDAGQTWRHFSTALREDTFPREIVNLGPRLLDHPRHGLLAFGNWFGEVDRYHALRQQLVVLCSPDGGATWLVEEHFAGFPQYEPAAWEHNGKILFVTRDQTKVRAHKQMGWQPRQPPQIIDTNLQDPRLVDTVDFCRNPVTKRFEIVRSERHCMELWLWSMDPRDWDKAQ